jgi:hypothetical protein
MSRKRSTSNAQCSIQMLAFGVGRSAFGVGRLLRATSAYSE